MTKKELIDLLAEAEEISRRAARKVVDAVFEDMSSALVKGDRVEIRGLGSFKIKRYNGYEGRNPKTGERVRIKSKKLPVFKVGKELRERVDR